MSLFSLGLRNGDQIDFGFNSGRMSTNSMQLAAKLPRKRKAPTLRDSDWDPYRAHFTELYNSGTTLKEIKKIMEDDYDFHAEYVHCS
jgi:hypothetical protein